MRRVIGAASLFLSLFITGCVPSLTPLYTESDVIFDPAILGVWTDGDQSETWEFVTTDRKEYRVVYTDEDGSVGRFKGRLFSIGDKLFIDLVPLSPPLSDNGYYRSHFAAMHTFVHIARVNEEFSVSYLRPEWLKSRLERQPSSIRHVVVEECVILADSTTNIQKFITAHLQTPGAYSDPVKFKRKERR